MGILTSIEQLILSLMLALIQVPKTLFYILRSPTWAIKYVGEQSTLQPADQFKEFATPLQYFVLIGCLPAYLVVSSLLQQVSPYDAQNSEGIGGRIEYIAEQWRTLVKGEGIGRVQMATAAIALSLFPVWASAAFTLTQTRALSRSDLIYFYQIFCYLSGTFIGGVLLIIGLANVLSPDVAKSMVRPLHYTADILAVVFFLVVSFRNTVTLAKTSSLSIRLTAEILIASALLWALTTYLLSEVWVALAKYIFT